MRIISFLKLVEIQTKTASVIPLLMGSFYAFFRFENFEWLHFVLMLVSLLAFDMATTAMNNYMDYKKAIKKTGYGYEIHNAIAQYRLSESKVLGVIVILILIAVASGVALVFYSHILVLFLGGLSFIAGFMYSFGPIPISRIPLGEIVSGVFMGFVIIFIAAFIHTGQYDLFWLELEGLGDGLIAVHFNIIEIIYMLVISIPAVMGIANIMLANNICDLEDDVANRRYTLPYYIGKKNALVLFAGMYAFSYADLPVLYMLGVHPLLLLIALLTVWPVVRRIRSFLREQNKAVTFRIAVNNFIIICLARIVILAGAML